VQGSELQINEDPLPKKGITDTKKWFDALDRLNREPFMIPAKKARNQPATPRREKMFA
jgi:hypothetical protein